MHECLLTISTLFPTHNRTHTRTIDRASMGALACMSAFEHRSVAGRRYSQVPATDHATDHKQNCCFTFLSFFLISVDRLNLNGLLMGEKRKKQSFLFTYSLGEWSRAAVTAC